MLDHLCRDDRKLDDLPSPLHPATRQASAALWARLRGMYHPTRGFRTLPGKAVETMLARSPCLWLTPLGVGLLPGIPADGPSLLRRASNSSTRRRSSAMTVCCSAITDSRVSRLALFRSVAVFTTPL